MRYHLTNAKKERTLEDAMRRLKFNYIAFPYSE